jgi:protein SCO1/2
MDAMAMPYKLKDPGIIQDLHAGDHLTANLLVSDDASLVDQIVVTMQAQPDYKPTALYHVPAAGDVVPDFHFTNQDGKKISIDQFHGKVLLLTFIYTRCPLSDYCPRMSRNFAAINKALQGDPALYRGTHLLSISFDPAYDKPAVLRSYGSAYTGNYTNETFAHWDFAAPAPDDLKKVLEYFDVGATPEKDRTITHSLSTVLIGPDGKVVAWYPTNDWALSDVLNAMKTAAGK